MQGVDWLRSCLRIVELVSAPGQVYGEAYAGNGSSDDNTLSVPQAGRQSIEGVELEVCVVLRDLRDMPFHCLTEATRQPLAINNSEGVVGGSRLYVALRFGCSGCSLASCLG